MSKPIISRELEAFCDGLETRWKIETVRDFIPKIVDLEIEKASLEDELRELKTLTENGARSLADACLSFESQRYEEGDYIATEFWHDLRGTMMRLAGVRASQNKRP